MKKALSLILAIILTLNVGLIAFATQDDELQTYLTKSEAESLAVDFVEKTSCYHQTKETTYSDGKFYSNVPVYEVISTVGLKSGDIVDYTTYVDKYTGKIYYRTAKFQRIMTPLSKKEALQYAYKVLCITEDNTTLLTEKQTKNEFSETVYQFTFCQSSFKRYDCTINAVTGFIDKVSVGTPSNIVERIILLFKMLIAKFRITDRLGSFGTII